MGKPISLEQVAALLAKPPQGVSSTKFEPRGGYEPPPQYGPLRWHENQVPCMSRGCRVHTPWRVNGIALCTIHALYRMNILVLETNGEDLPHKGASGYPNLEGVEEVVYNTT
jgi:hypothetical protein